MKRFEWMKPALVMAGMMACAAPVLAGETGADFIHAERREHGRLCFVDHYHYGSSQGQASKKAALAVGVKSWSDFVAFEYGSDWSRWSLASSKSVKCSQEGIRGPWGCDISARPCR